jgi:sodium/hydrogen antiporter
MAVIAGCFVVWGLVSRRAERLEITAPLAFVVFGLVLCNGPWAVVHVALHSGTIETFAEDVLAVVLFADASRVNLRELRTDAGPPLRLLGIGLPLTLGLATLVALALFGSAGAWVAATIAAVVTPTDAALGAPVLLDERVPARVRRTLNVESGLNDGIVTPVVNLCIVGAVTATASLHTALVDAVLELAGGVGLGIAFGCAGAVALRLARRAGWSGMDYAPLGVLGLALCTYGTALATGANGFVAAFVAGLCFGALAGRVVGVRRFSEGFGTLLSLLIWFFFGAAMLVPGLRVADVRDVVFAVGALTVVRMVPVAIALIGSGFSRPTVAFIGWFGPRGLASVIFGLIALDSLDQRADRVLIGAVTTTIALSVLLHGVTASPLAARYSRRATGLGADRPENVPTPGLDARSLSAGALGGATPGADQPPD